METITLDTAKAIAADWHGGQFTALYSFASTGIVDARAGDHLAEIDAELKHNDLSKHDMDNLEKLRQFIEANTVNALMNELVSKLAEEGLKETRDTALHTDSMEDFIWYMETDIAERQRALQIANELIKTNVADQNDTPEP